MNAVSLLVSSNITNMMTYVNIATSASSSDPYYGWRTAVIVIGVFLGVALLLAGVVAIICYSIRGRLTRYKQSGSSDDIVRSVSYR
ncbi:hypothetical protein XENTR_v10004792 [Xenopus tropicalis]|nr:hypothetical protein XENTR_v10004792 [Xenopus tropicalis]